LPWQNTSLVPCMSSKRVLGFGGTPRKGVRPSSKMNAIHGERGLDFKSVLPLATTGITPGLTACLRPWSPRKGSPGNRRIDRVSLGSVPEIASKAGLVKVLGKLQPCSHDPRGMRLVRIINK